MDLNRYNWVFQVVSYVIAALAFAWGIWWCWKHGWPWPFNSQKVQIEMFMGAPVAVLFAIIWFFYRGKGGNA